MMLISLITISGLNLSLSQITQASTTDEEQTSNEKCSVGLDILKGMIDKGNALPSAIELYDNELREDELKAYIDENIDDIAIPDWMEDSKSALCLIAGGIVEQEKLQGSKFTEGSNELDEAITLQALKTQGEVAENVMSPEE